MEDSLRDATVTLVVTGGIAAYKAPFVLRALRSRGAHVEVVLTEAATKFVGPLTFSALAGRAPHVDLFDPAFAGERHVDLAERSDLVVVCPATADFMGRVALGLAHDLATALLLCFDGPIVLAPAMHARMWAQDTTQSHVTALRARGATIVGPVEGALANGQHGLGRMAEPEAIVEAVEAALQGARVERVLAGRTVVVSAGPTYEALDPVRFLGNRSSGRMGFAIAEAARDAGADVVLVCGPVSRPPPDGVRVVRVQDARAMLEAIEQVRPGADAIVMAAAVADYRPVAPEPRKMKKTGDELVLRLVRNPDILATLGAARAEARRPVLVGFALETEDLVANARKKLLEKRCDLIVANLAEDGFEGADNLVTLVTHEGVEPLPRMPKSAIARRLVEVLATRINAASSRG